MLSGYVQASHPQEASREKPWKKAIFHLRAEAAPEAEEQAQFPVRSPRDPPKERKEGAQGDYEDQGVKMSFKL